MRRRRALALGLLLAGLAGIACRPGLDSSEASTLRLSVRADMRGLFPEPLVAETYSIHTNANVFEGLTAFASDLKIVPGLAERWETPGSRSWVFHLRPGLLFSDGRPLTASDVVESFAAARRYTWTSEYFLRSIESARVRSADEVEITTRTVDPLLLSQLPWAFVIPAAAANTAGAEVVGSGPYRVESRQPGRRTVFARNPHYRGAAPEFDRVEFSVSASDQERIRSVIEGRADYADHVPFEEAIRLQRRPGVTVVLRSGLMVLYLAMRVDRQPFADPRVRQAIDLSIDREALVERALSGLSRPASQIVPPAVAGFAPDLPPPDYNPDRARELLAAAGHRRGISVRLDGPNDHYTGAERIMREIARQLEAVGIRVQVNAIDKDAFFRLLDARGSDLHLVGWSCESGDASSVLEALFRTQGEASRVVGNTTGISDTALDQIVDEIGNGPPLPERKRLLRSAVARVAELRPVVPLLIETEAFVLSEGVQWDPPLNLALRFADFRRPSHGSSPPKR